jgi:hypothetical protein
VDQCDQTRLLHRTDHHLAQRLGGDGHALEVARQRRRVVGDCCVTATNDAIILLLSPSKLQGLLDGVHLPDSRIIEVLHDVGSLDGRVLEVDLEHWHGA